MPTYEFRCANGHTFDQFHKISDAPSTATCPICGAEAERAISGGAGLVFKGSGFYLTDYGKNAHRTGGGTPAKGDAKGESKGDGGDAGKKSDNKSESTGGKDAPSSSGSSGGSGSGGGTSGSSSGSSGSTSGGGAGGGGAGGGAA